MWAPKKRLQVAVVSVSARSLLLQEAPFGLQDLVLLLQEPHLPSNRKRDIREQSAANSSLG